MAEPSLGVLKNNQSLHSQLPKKNILLLLMQQKKHYGYTPSFPILLDCSPFPLFSIAIIKHQLHSRRMHNITHVRSISTCDSISFTKLLKQVQSQSSIVPLNKWLLI